MTRTLLAAIAASFVLAAPAYALDPAPTVLDFEAPEPGTAAESLYPGSGASLAATGGGTTGGIPCATVEQPGRGSVQALDVCFGGVFEVRFDQPQTSVSMWVSVSPFSEGGDAIDAVAFDASGQPVERKEPIPNGSRPFGVPVVFGTSLSAPAISSVRITANSSYVVDDVSFSPYGSPDTTITAGPANPARTTDAAFAFSANQSDTGFDCSLDGARAVPCRGSVSYSGLAAGPHTFTVAARDAYGTPDPSPAAYAWTVDLSPPPPLAAPAARDSDGDGVPDARDDCPASANAAQGDLDKDGVGDACEVGEPGTLVPVTGSRVVVTVLSGEVFVKLPASASSARRLAQNAPIPGYVPLKGVAALPTGTIVDARKGRVALDSTVNGRRIGAGGSRQRATLAAGIFRIRQQRAALGSAARVPTDFVLTSAPGAESACVRVGTSGPIKGRGRSIVRSLTASTQKGLFRVVGAAGTSTARSATWVMQDRCDGTRTDVGKGSVAVASAVGEKRTVTVTSGRSYTIKAAIFAAKRG